MRRSKKQFQSWDLQGQGWTRDRESGRILDASLRFVHSWRKTKCIRIIGWLNNRSLGQSLIQRHHGSNFTLTQLVNPFQIHMILFSPSHHSPSLYITGFSSRTDSFSLPSTTVPHCLSLVYIALLLLTPSTSDAYLIIDLDLYSR